MHKRRPNSLNCDAQIGNDGSFARPPISFANVLLRIMKKIIFRLLIAVMMVVFATNTFAQSKGIQPIRYDSMPSVLPGTKEMTSTLSPLETSRKMLEGAHQFIERKIAGSVAVRSQLWKRDLSSSAAYARSIDGNRMRFMHAIGVVDKNKNPANYNVGFPDRHPQVSMLKISIAGDPEAVAETGKY